MIPMIINNRDSGPPDQHSHPRSNSPNKIYISKTLVDQPTAEERQRVLDELLKKNSVPKTPEQPKKVIEPLVVNKETLVPVEQPKPAIVTQKSTETKIIGENKNYGVVKLTVHYDELRHRLSITCHQAQ